LTIQGQAIAAVTADHHTVLPVEIAFLEWYGVDPGVLRRAAAIAWRTGAFADEIMIRLNLVAEETYYRALARHLGLPFLTTVEVGAEAQFPYSILIGLARLAPSPGGARSVLAPTGRWAAWVLTRRRPFGEGFAVTTPAALRGAVFRVHAKAIAAQAANGLPNAEPRRSYRDRSTLAQKRCAAGVALALLAGVLAAPDLVLSAAFALSGLVFLAVVMVRLAALQEHIPTRPPRRASRQPDDRLPIYTVIVALRRERRVLARLVAALEALDYPKAKLDIKLVIEADDAEMADAFAHMALPGHFEVIVAPPGEPRTKPRALNVALPLARGELVTVYDAEDVPDPDQLRLAAATFTRASADIACLQARLVIDNTDDNWLTRLFTIEYATLFDVINPGLALNDLPIPLGGTSNHFRADVLRDLHGWDAWNVTEDADLGIRLALAGWRVLDLPSSTLEEAPGTLGAWLKQRSRWMKGFMQVVIAHSRHPLDALHALGPTRFFAAVALTLGTVATALGYPLFMVLALHGLYDGAWLNPVTAMEIFWSTLGLTLFGTGLFAMTAPTVIAIERRGWRRLYPFVPLLPLYYGLISIAAWRALWELTRAPFLWHKTEHGLARTSRATRGRRTGTARPSGTPNLSIGADVDCISISEEPAVSALHRNGDDLNQNALSALIRRLSFGLVDHIRSIVARLAGSRHHGCIQTIDCAVPQKTRMT
jgi:cellulose synthase/poly-beta-1,6-N-acetylglucosamine synthase-like glycosyltransferase